MNNNLSLIQTPEIPDPPEGLGSAGAELWRAILGEFDLSGEPQKNAVLERACRTADLIEKLEAQINNTPMTSKGSMGQEVIHPFIAEHRQQTNVFNSLMKSLSLPETQENAEYSATKRSQQARKAVNTRWGNRA